MDYLVTDVKGPGVASSMTGFIGKHADTGITLQF